MEVQEIVENKAEISALRRHRTKGMLGLALIQLILRLLEVFPNDLFLFCITTSLTFAVIFYMEEFGKTWVASAKAVLCGLIAPTLMVMVPRFAIYNICSQYISLFGVAISLAPNYIYLQIKTNVLAWICYLLAYKQSLIAGLGEVGEYSLNLRDPINFYQLLFCVIIGYWTLSALAQGKLREIRLNNAYNSKLISLNQELKDSNCKLQQINNELQLALQEKEDFVLRFSHEIRNPLNSLLGNVELCYEYVEDDDAKQMLTDAKISGEILLQLLNNVLDTAKISTGRLDISKHPQDIKEFLERSWVVCSEIIRKKDLYGCLYLDSHIPEFLEFDNHRVMQILINTVSNAAKFTEFGNVNIFVDYFEGDEINPADMKPKHADSYEKLSEGDTVLDHINTEQFDENPGKKYDYLTIMKKKFSPNLVNGRMDFASKYSSSLPPNMSREWEIASNKADLQIQNAPVFGSSAELSRGFIRFEIIDTGCGIKKKDLENLFTKFNQVNEESSKRQIGTGLGLWITKEIVELMSGKIEVHSVVDHGTTIVIMLKSKAVPCLNLGSNFKSPQTDSWAITSVLVVEDIPYNQEVNSKFLKKCGIEHVQIANNGKEALELVQEKGEGGFDVIFMDIDMPVMDGKAATKSIRQYEQSKRWRAVKIVFLTAYSDAKTQEELMDPKGEYRADAFLAKPASFEVIYKTLMQLKSKTHPPSTIIRKKFGIKSPLSQPDSLSRRESNKNTILVVDDDSFNLSMISRMLLICGFEPIEARNGKAAVELYEARWKEIKFILMDCEMPIMDGWEATKQILKKHKKRAILSDQDVVIYGLTGHVRADYKQKCLQAGMKDVMEKPIKMERLRSLLLPA